MSECKLHPACDGAEMWFSTCLNLPDWLVDFASTEDEKATRLHVRKSGGKRVRRMMDTRINRDADGKPIFGVPHDPKFETVVTGVTDYVVTPDHEDVIFFEPKSQWYRNVVYQDIEQLGMWRKVGGPKWTKELGMNPRQGEPVVICPLSCVDSGEFPEQPWGADWKARLEEMRREELAEMRMQARPALLDDIEDEKPE